MVSGPVGNRSAGRDSEKSLNLRSSAGLYTDSRHDISKFVFLYSEIISHEISTGIIPEIPENALTDR